MFSPQILHRYLRMVHPLTLLAGDDAVKDELEALIQQQRDKTAEVLAAATDPNHGPHTQPKTEAATKANKYELTSSYRITELIRLSFYSDVFTKLSPKVKSTPLNPPAKRTADKALEDLGVLIPAQAYLATSAAAHPTHRVQPMALRDTTNHIQEALSALSGARNRCTRKRSCTSPGGARASCRRG